MKKATGLLLAAVLALGVAACGGDELNGDSGSADSGGSGSAGQSITVGSANFPENVVLAEIYAGALSAKGFKVDKKLNVGSREAIFPAMERGDINVLPEYTGALLSYVSKGKATAKETADQVTELKSNLPATLTLLDASEAQDQDTVTCTKEAVDKWSLTSLEDLAKVSKEVTMGGPPELAKREGFGLKGLKAVYGIEFKQFRPLDVAGPLTVSALKSGKVDCANLFSTQSAIPVNGFVSLEDPKGLVESEAVVPLIAKDKATPEATKVLNAVSAKLTTDNLKEMVKSVEVDKDDAATVADDFLGQNGLN
jgi:osmoprotectant transport system substrate-binding protein